MLRLHRAVALLVLPVPSAKVLHAEPSFVDVYDILGLEVELEEGQCPSLPKDQAFLGVALHGYLLYLAVFEPEDLQLLEHIGDGDIEFYAFFHLLHDDLSRADEVLLQHQVLDDLLDHRLFHDTLVPFVDEFSQQLGVLLHLADQVADEALCPAVSLGDDGHLLLADDYIIDQADLVIECELTTALLLAQMGLLIDVGLLRLKEVAFVHLPCQLLCGT